MGSERLKLDALGLAGLRVLTEVDRPKQPTSDPVRKSTCSTP